MRKFNIEKYKNFSIGKILYFINLVFSNKSHRQQQQNSRDISARSVQGTNIHNLRKQQTFLNTSGN